jgi:hypothetical protein
MENPESESRQIISRYEELLVRLARAEVDFCVVGGLAVVLCGYVRATEDADILIHDSPDNVRRLLAVLVGWGEGWARELRPEEFTPQEGSLRVSEEFDLDIFTRMRGRSLEDFRPRLRTFTTQGCRIFYLSPQDLISLKEGSWRDKDQIDVLAMKEASQREEGGK